MRDLRLPYNCPVNSIKRDLIETIEGIPDDTPNDQVLHELRFRLSILQGVEDVRAGRVTGHEDVMERLRTWRESPGRTKPFDV